MPKIDVSKYVDNKGSLKKDVEVKDYEVVRSKRYERVLNFKKK